MTDFRYKAFVSYSWADAEWGKWLLQAIETYRTPAALVGKDGAGGPVPARLHPLFKDREEEAAGASIGQAVETALAGSEFLIVICSPRSARSQWVDREIAWFKTHRDPTKILALIVDGNPGGGDSECFPRALTHRVAADRTITDEPVDAPLAADARISGDGKRRAKLKLAAAMLGVGLDELVNRDERRRTIRTRIVVGASLALATVMTGMAWAAVVARNEADHQRAESDGLVEFMLTDLRKRLEPVGRLDALDVVGQRALTYYAGQKPGSLDADALGRRARALHLVGEVSNLRGDSVGGLNAFRQAAATTKEQLARDPDNPQRIFDHAQSVFWVGYIAYERGETKEAEVRFREYKVLADRLTAIDPKKPEWQMEVSYADTNLGVLYYDSSRFSEAEPAFGEALDIVKTLAAHAPLDTGRQLEIGLAINWLAKTKTELHKISQALELHHQEIAIYDGVLKNEPSNTQAEYRSSVAWLHIGKLELASGRVPVALAATGKALTMITRLRKVEPANTAWQETEVRALIGQADNMLYSPRRSESAALLREAGELLDQMAMADPKNVQWTVGLRSDLDVQRAMSMLASEQFDQALKLASTVCDRLASASSFDPPEKAKLFAKAELVAGDALVKLGHAERAKTAWKSGLEALSPLASGKSSLVLRLRFMLSKRLGRHAEAEAAAQMLRNSNDQHPAWLRERVG